ncbi:MAG: hypothetical protein Ct9H90mP19_2320 [Gammaproteobacteria bacterium]|nr:MAG: hypothetical protein Ct9H90mP19_2320 [Gammaproteobacteria bacterium]
MLGEKDLIGFSIIEDYERQYDSHPSFFHVLGHMGYLNQSDTDYFLQRLINTIQSYGEKSANQD